MVDEVQDGTCTGLPCCSRVWRCQRTHTFSYMGWCIAVEVIQLRANACGMIIFAFFIPLAPGQSLRGHEKQYSLLANRRQFLLLLLRIQAIHVLSS